MIDEKNGRPSLAMMALKDIPQAKENAKEIVAMIKEKGRVTGYELSDGSRIDKEAGVEMARQGEIRGVGVATRNGSEYLKSLPDEGEANNLSNLPSAPE